MRLEREANLYDLFLWYLVLLNKQEDVNSDYQ